VAKKIPLTRPELKRQRDMLARFERYLPMLKLKQQQLQLTLGQVEMKRRRVQANVDGAAGKIGQYEPVLADVSGVNVRQLGACRDVRTSPRNVAGVEIPVFEGVEFPPASYSLFATPSWVDRAIADLRDLSRHQAELDVLDKQCRLLRRELTKIIQRVNLFEKVKIPTAREAIRIIRIKLGDEMTAAVGRAKIAKAKVAESQMAIYGASAAGRDGTKAE